MLLCKSQMIRSYLMEMHVICLQGLELLLRLLRHADSVVSGQTQIIQLFHNVFHLGLESGRADSSVNIIHQSLCGVSINVRDHNGHFYPCSKNQNKSANLLVDNAQILEA